MKNNQSNLKKIFLAEISARLVGKSVNSKFYGTQKELNLISEALSASKEFHDELNNPSATLDSVILKLGKKHVAVLNFEKALGFSWPM